MHCTRVGITWQSAVPIPRMRCCGKDSSRALARCGGGQDSTPQWTTAGTRLQGRHHSSHRLPPTWVAARAVAAAAVWACCMSIDRLTPRWSQLFCGLQLALDTAARLRESLFITWNRPLNRQTPKLQLNPSFTSKDAALPESRRPQHITLSPTAPHIVTSSTTWVSSAAGGPRGRRPGRCTGGRRRCPAGRPGP